MKIMNSSQHTTIRNSFSSKTTMRYRLTPVRMGFTKKSEESMKKRESYYTAGGNINVGAATLENDMQIS